MKKLFKMALMAMGIVALSTVLCSCSKNDDGGSDKPAEPVGTQIALSYIEKGDILTIAELHVKYKDASGKEVDEVVKDGHFKKAININKYPFTFEASAYYVPLAGATVDPETTYKSERGFGHNVETTYSNGKVYQNIDTKANISSVKGSDVDKFFATTTPKILSTTIGTDGKCQ